MALVKIVTGEYNSGKTTIIKELLAESLARGLNPAGIITETEQGGAKQKYWVKNVATGERVLAVSLNAPDNDPGWVKYEFSRFKFYKPAFGFIQNSLEQAVSDNADLVLIDELGPLELSGRGSFNAVNKFLAEYHGEVYIVIRKKILIQLCENLGLRINELEIITANYQDQ